jgi:hypothetical protein
MSIAIGSDEVETVIAFKTKLLHGKQRRGGFLNVLSSAISQNSVMMLKNTFQHSYPCVVLAVCSLANTLKFSRPGESCPKKRPSKRTNSSDSTAKKS